MNFEARTRKVCKIAGQYFIPPAALALKLLKDAKAGDRFLNLIKKPKKVKRLERESDIHPSHREPPGAPPEALTPPVNDYDIFRDAYRRGIFNEENRYISFLDENGVRRPAVIEGFDSNRRLIVVDENGKRIPLTNDELRETRFSSSAKRALAHVAPQVEPNRLVLHMSSDPSTNAFRKAFNERRLTENERYLSIQYGNQRVPVKVSSYGDDFLEVVDENGLTKKLTRAELESAHVSGTAQQRFAALEAKTIKLSQDENTNIFRKAFNTNNFSGDAQFASYKMGDQRVAIRIIGREGDAVRVENADGYRYLLRKDDLETIRFSNTSKTEFLKNENLAGVQRIGPAEDNLQTMGDPAYDTFRLNFNRGEFVAEQRYVSVMSGSVRRPARIVNVDADKIIVELVDDDSTLRKVEIHGSDLMSVRSSASSHQSFDDSLKYALDLPEAQIRGQAVGHYEQPGFAIDLNLNSPGLKRWVGESQRLIERDLGIKPGQPLSREQQLALENYWISRIRPKLESTESYSRYGKDRGGLASRNAGRADLGQVIEEGKAVCLELSMFASTLLSQYGIKSKLVIGRTNLRSAEAGQHGYHAWLRIVDDEDKTLGLLDSNNSQSIHPNIGDYDRALNGVKVEREIQLIQL